MDWHISLAIFYFFAVAKSLSQRRYMRRTKLAPSIIAAFSNLVGLVPLGIIVGLMLPHHIDWSVTTVGLIALEGLCIGIYGKLAYTGIQRLPIAQFQTLNQSFNVFVIMLGWIVLNETMSGYQLAGASLILLSVALAAFADRSRHKNSIGGMRTVGLVIGAAAIFSIGLIAEKAALGDMDIGAYFIFGFSAQLAVNLIIAAADFKKNTHHITRNDYKNFFIMGATTAAAGFAYLLTVRAADNISLIITLNSFALPLTALASYWLLHERENMRQLWASIAIGVLGVILTAI